MLKSLESSSYLFSLRRCCNSCEDVKDAYRTKGWAVPPLKDIEQCVREGKLVESEELPKEGCQMYGYLEVNRVRMRNIVVPRYFELYFAGVMLREITEAENYLISYAKYFLH